MLLQRSMIACLAAGAALLIALPAQANKYNGRWNVVLTTDVGQCEPSIAAAFAVKADDILADGESALRADGAVEPNGSMWVRFSAGQDQYRAQGKLAAATGSGVWSSGSRYCGGKWRATRER